MPFSSLNLDPAIVQAIVDSGYAKPTPIQEAAIPQILAGSDLLASAQTGSGKTAAFILPALHKLRSPAKDSFIGPRMLVLVPTRELAMQVATQAVKYSKHMTRTRTVCIYGGAPYPVQNRQLSRPYEILVATPGRLIDHLDRGRIDLSRVELFVLDEADRMLDMGFISAVERISGELAKNVQTVMFSATFEPEILKLSRTILKKPIEINVGGNKKRHEGIEQFMYYADNLNHKLKLLGELLKDPAITQAIIFTSTKMFADELVNILEDNGHYAGVLHGDLNQRQRTSTTRRFREGQISLLVATDVAARGIDIPAISHVINFDLPPNVEDYIHRIGRTGRADAKGVALSFALGRDRVLVERIEKYTGRAIATKTIEGMEPSIKKDFKPGKKPNGPKRGFQRGFGGRKPPRSNASFHGKKRSA